MPEHDDIIPGEDRFRGKTKVDVCRGTGDINRLCNAMIIGVAGQIAKVHSIPSEGSVSLAQVE